MERMLNPWLRDQVERVIRDPERKLGWSDRLVGTLRLCLSKDVQPACFASGAKVAIRYLSEQENRSITPDQLISLWKRSTLDRIPSELLPMLFDHPQ